MEPMKELTLLEWQSERAHKDTLGISKLKVYIE